MPHLRKEVPPNAMLLVPPGPPGQNMLDPAAIPLPQSHDADLSVPHVIAQAQDCDPSPKVAGARCRGIKPTGKSEKAKGKGKEKEKENTGAEKSKK